MNRSESNDAPDALRDFFETIRKAAAKIMAEVIESAETLAEELEEALALLIESAEAAVEAILPAVIEEVRRRAVVHPAKKDAPRKLGTIRASRQHTRKRPCARSRI